MPYQHEHLRRVTNLQAQMGKAGVDLTAIAPTSNMRYLLGFSPVADERLCLFLVTPEATELVVPALNADQMEARAGMEVRRWSDEAGPREALQRALEDLDALWSPVVAADAAMRADALLLLQEVAQPARSISAADLMAGLRMRKSESEIAALTRAAAQADRVMMVGIEACRRGVTERYVAQQMAKAFRDDGAEEVHATLVASGANSAFPHHEAGNRELEQGDTIILDIVATLDGYNSDITRVVHLGEPSEDVREVHATVLEANQRGREAARAGARACDVDRAARSVVEAAGYGEAFIHRTGHGLGLEGHEPPWISGSNTQTLEQGMVFSVEPGIYLPGHFGVRIEDIIVITDGPCRCLTGFDRALIVKDL